MSTERPLFIPVLLGTVRQGRMSEHVARFVRAALAKYAGVETELIDLREMHFPATDEGEGVKDAGFSAAMARADGLVIVAPLVGATLENR